MVLHSFRKQNLLVEYASLRTSCPSGIYVVISPVDTTLWHAVLFVRNGIYAPAILRFRINFPNEYPEVPPVVVFETDIFHPLLLPLTTYSYVSNNTETSSKDSNVRNELLLPPGGFSLHGMRSQIEGQLCNDTMSHVETSNKQNNITLNNFADTELAISRNVAASDVSLPPSASQMSKKRPRYAVAKVLYYIKVAFSSHDFLDSILVDDAVNPGAFFAWRSHRLSTAPDDYNRCQEKAKKSASSQSPTTTRTSKGDSPNVWSGQWNWDGVWKDRVHKAVQASIADSTLFGSASSDDFIRFLNLDDNTLEKVAAELSEQFGHSPNAEVTTARPFGHLLRGSRIRHSSNLNTQ